MRGGGDEKSLGYFELTNKPIGVISENFIVNYNEEELIKIEDFVEQLGVLEIEQNIYVFVYDKDVSNTINFTNTVSYNAKIVNGNKDCIELAPNRFCFRQGK